MNRRSLLLASGAVLVVAAAVATAIVLGGEKTSDSTRPRPTTTTSLSPLETVCLLNGGDFRVRISFSRPDADEHMRRAEDALRDDERVARLATETQSEAYERFKEVFKDRPDILENARPEYLPASIEVDPAEGVGLSELAEQLKTELAGVDSIEERACET